MSKIRTLVSGLSDRRKADRRVPAITAPYEGAVDMIREMKYTGETVTHWIDGVPKRIEFPNPVGIHLSAS